jgi:hypothetical protein
MRAARIYLGDTASAQKLYNFSLGIGVYLNVALGRHQR